MIPTLILWFALLATRPVQAPDPSLQEKEIASVIQQQLDAFTFNDYETAYRFASKQIHTQFSQEQYAEMVRTDYLQITKSIRVAFGKIQFAPDPIHATARVEITGFNHKKVTAEYRMIHEDDGWKVDGITILPVRTRGAVGPATAPLADREKTLEEIASVIRRQLDAFKRDDYARAYTFVSKAFRAQFSQDRFETMIRARFPEIARSAATRWGRTFLFMDNTRATLEIDVTGVSARSIAVEYRMVLEEGGWKIDGLAHLNPFRHF